MKTRLRLTKFNLLPVYLPPSSAESTLRPFALTAVEMPCFAQGSAANPLALDDDDEVHVLSDTETEVDDEDEDATFSAASHLGSPDTDGEAAAAPGARTLASIVEEICRLGTFRGVGLIVGPTGSGKTRLLNALVKRGVVNPAAETEVWPEHRTVVSALAERCGGVQAAMSRLNAVGLNTVPEWVKPFSALSNGQQARALAHTVGTCATDQRATHSSHGSHTPAGAVLARTLRPVAHAAR